jgi:signal transduction histidine kinase
MVIWYLYHRVDIESQNNPWWGRVQTLGSVFSGILWGLSAVLFAPLDDAHMLFVALVIGGMCAGAATVHAAYFPSVAAFLVPALLPLAGKFFVAGNRLQAIAGILVCIFGISLSVASLKFRRWFNDITAARMELDEVNVRLTAEIASRRSAEAKLHHALRLEAVGRLTAGIAHDFNNLLMSVGGSAGLITMHLASHPVCAPYIATIMEAVERGTTLTRRLLAFGRKQSLSPHAIDINEVLQSLEKLLLATLGGYGQLVLQLERHPTVAFVDSGELESAILNLVINARDAMPHGGLVTISTSNVELSGTESDTDGLRGKFVRIAVSDTGMGMSEAVRLQAFDPFFTTKEIGEGSGLGLSQVYGLVQQSGGVTEIASEIGRGTTVTIYLPRDSRDAMPDRTTPLLPTVSASQGLKVLLLDDDAQVRQTITAILSAAGYSVASYSTGRQALDAIREQKPIDVMIVDYAMPDIRGDQFAAEARLRHVTAPIVFITGYAETSSLKAEPWVLRKPFKATTLIQTIEQATQVAA